MAAPSFVAVCAFVGAVLLVFAWWRHSTRYIRAARGKDVGVRVTDVVVYPIK